MKRSENWKKLWWGVSGIVLCSAAAAFAGESSNGIHLNGIHLNGIHLNGLHLKTISSSANDLVVDARQRDALRVITECALEPGDQAVVERDGVTYTFAGALGLAPEWKAGALSPGGQRWVTACLLAHVNHFGVHLPVSLRGAHPGLQTTQAEAAAYRVEEAAFYGNLFSEAPLAASCIGRHGLDPKASPDLKYRVCATSAREGETACGFVAVGTCQAVCGVSYDEKGERLGYTECRTGSNGIERISEVITVWLRQQAQTGK